MPQNFSFHSPLGAGDFLGFRRSPAGQGEIVYDDGVRRRMVFRIASPRIDEARLGDALSIAVAQARVLPALFAELKKRAIVVEAVV